MQHPLILASSQALDSMLARFSRAHIDIGCGDGLATLRYAIAHPDTAVIGTDTSLDHLHRRLRKPPANLGFVRHDATTVHPALRGRFDSATIAFPFGSLLRAIVHGNPESRAAVLSPLRSSGALTCWINESALATLASGSVTGFSTDMHAVDVSRCAARDVDWPSTWAKRTSHTGTTTVWLIRGSVDDVAIKVHKEPRKPSTVAMPT